MSATDSTTSAKSVAPDDSFFAKNGTYICFALRLLLCFGFVSRTTQWFHTASALSFLRDPTWTMEQVEESIALKILSQNATVWDSYASGTVHMPVLVLLLLEQLARLPSSVVPILLGIFLSIIDALIGNFLQKNAEFLQKRDYEEEHRIQKLMPDELKPPHEALFHAKDGDEEPLLAPMNALPQWVSQIYFYSPATIISSACLQCMHNVPVLCLLGALHTVLHGSTILAGIILALSAYMDIHNVVFLGPLILLARERKKSGAPLVVGFLLINVCMQVATVLLVGSDRYWQVLNATHLHSFVVVGMSPNLSPLWYLGMELFDRFHLYSTILVGCMPYITLLSIYTRLWRYPGSMMAILWLMHVLFRPPSTLYGLTVAFSLLASIPRTMVYMRALQGLVTTIGWVIPVSLYSVTHWLWLGPGNGEANYVFFQCFAYNVLLAILTVQTCSAVARREEACRYVLHPVEFQR